MNDPNGAGHDRARGMGGDHLSDEQLNRYLDGDLGAAERAEVRTHLVACASCLEKLGDLRVINHILRQTTPVAVPRSFQLGAEYARRPASAGWAARLLPLLPAMRAATLVLLLAFGSVSAYRIARDEPDTGPDSEQAVSLAPTEILPVQQSSVPEIETPPSNTTIALESAPSQPTGTTIAVFKGSAQTVDASGDNNDDAGVSRTTAGGANSSAPMSGAAAESSLATETISLTPPATDELEQTNAMAADQAAFSTETMTIAATSTQRASVTPLPTRSPSPPATATPAPTPAARQSSSDDDSTLSVLQILLGLLFALSAVVTIGLTRTRNHVR